MIKPHEYACVSAVTLWPIYTTPTHTLGAYGALGLVTKGGGMQKQQSACTRRAVGGIIHLRRLCYLERVVR
jgi:hypothetical protein